MIETTMNRPRFVTQEAIEHAEGKLARRIEQQTAKLPSDVFLWAAVGAMAASLGLQIAGDKPRSLFVGQWAAPLLIFGLYNKLVKVAGSDRVMVSQGNASDSTSCCGGMAEQP